MDLKKIRVTMNKHYKYIHLDPIPDEKELGLFYESMYYDLIRRGERAIEIKRLISGGEEAENELNWLKKTLYSDISYFLGKNKCKKILDVGCGTGNLIEHLNQDGFYTCGIDLSKDAINIAQKKSLNVYEASLKTFKNEYSDDKDFQFSSVIMINVLEHVPNPVQFIEDVKEYLVSGGILCLRVPNDFNEIQKIAVDDLEKDPWWIAKPDHINYFTFDSLHYLLEQLGFEIIHSQGDFPMELFLLMGEDYIHDKKVGFECHKKRMALELSLTPELRRKMYTSLGKIGISRTCFVIAKLR